MAEAKAVEAAKPAKKSNRKKLYALHSWLGFHLALIMAIVLATGTIATISHEIDWLIRDEMRVSPDGHRVSWETMANAIYDHAPGDTITSLAAMEGDHFAYRARVADEYGRQRFVHVNQWTGEVTGDTGLITVQRIFRDLHRYLFMPNYIGLPLVTSLAFVLAMSLYTGLKTTRNWKTIMFRVRTDKGKRILWGDAHKAAGIWGSWFFLVIIITGVWYLVEFGFAIGIRKANVEDSFPSTRLSAERVEQLGPVIEDAALDDVIAAARAAYPGLKVTNILFPTRANATFAVQGMVGNPFIRERSNTVHLDPVSLEVVTIRKWKEYPTFFALNELADPLHFGYFAGLPTKLIWFVFGIAMTGLSVTGVWLTWKRVKTTIPSKTQYGTMPALIISMMFCTVWYERLQGPEAPNREQLLAIRHLNQGLHAALKVAVDQDGQPTGLVRVVFITDAGRPGIKSATVTIGDHEVQQKIRFLGRSTESRYKVDPTLIVDNREISVTIQSLGEQEETTRFRPTDKPTNDR